MSEWLETSLDLEVVDLEVGMDLYGQMNSAGFEKKDSSSGCSRRLFIQSSDQEQSTMPFTVAFNLAANSTRYGETPLVICKRNKCGFGGMPPVVTDIMGPEELQQYRQNRKNVRDGEWDLNTVSKIKVQHAESLEDFLAFLCSVHKWKKETPSLIVIDDLASLFQGSSRSYQEMLGVVSHIQNALLSLNDELRDEASQAIKASGRNGGDPVDMPLNKDDVLEDNMPSVLLRKRTQESSEIAVILSESSQNAQICEHLNEKLHLGMHVQVAALERNADQTITTKAKINFSPAEPRVFRNKKRSRAAGQTESTVVVEPLYLELEDSSVYSMTRNSSL